MNGHSWLGNLDRAHDTPRKPQNIRFRGIFADVDAIARRKI